MSKFYFFENEPLHEQTFVEMRQYIVNVEMQPRLKTLYRISKLYDILLCHY